VQIAQALFRGPRLGFAHCARPITGEKNYESDKAPVWWHYFVCGCCEIVAILGGFWLKGLKTGVKMANLITGM